MRTIGEAVGRVAEAEVALLRSNIEAPLVETQQLVDVARTYVGVADEVFPRISDALDTLHRHHLQAIGRRYSDVGAPTSALNVVQLAVGFADLAGLHRAVAGARAATSSRRCSTGSRRHRRRDRRPRAPTSSKRIGDAVMFVTNAPGVACALALELLEACAAAGLPKLRVGVAFGDVMVRQGDFYGPTVNLAARLVVGGRGRHRAHRRASCTTGSHACAAATRSWPPGKYNLAGFVEPVEAYQLLRP